MALVFGAASDLQILVDLGQCQKATGVVVERPQQHPLQAPFTLSDARKGAVFTMQR